jgi:hypothetical protein
VFGLLGGAVAAAFKAVQGRTSAAPATAGAPAPWTPIPDAQPVVVPPRAAAAPSTPAPPRPKVDLAALQESPADPAPSPAPAKKRSATPKPKKLAPWVEPGADGEAPSTHPVKAKMSSGIYHVPGGFNYARTKPDRCYLDVAAAEADGLRPSKR